jgi:N-acetylneuraminate synthase
VPRQDQFQHSNLKIFEEERNKKIGLLHCVAEYGVDLENVNLNVLNTFKLAFPNVVIGYSDHSVDPVIAPKAAVVLGAKIIEKHITLDKKLEGPDHFFALDFTGLSLMVKAIRDTERKIEEGKKIAIDKKILGTSEKKIYSSSEKGARNFTHRCIFSQRTIKKGEIFTPKNIIVLRPGNINPGLEPKYYELLIKKYRTTRDIPKYSPVSWDDVLLK